MKKFTEIDCIYYNLTVSKNGSEIGYCDIIYFHELNRKKIENRRGIYIITKFTPNDKPLLNFENTHLYRFQIEMRSCIKTSNDFSLNTTNPSNHLYQL